MTLKPLKVVAEMWSSRANHVYVESLLLVVPPQVRRISVFPCVDTCVPVTCQPHSDLALCETSGGNLQEGSVAEGEAREIYGE